MEPDLTRYRPCIRSPAWKRTVDADTATGTVTYARSFCSFTDRLFKQFMAGKTDITSAISASCSRF